MKLMRAQQMDLLRQRLRSVSSSSYKLHSVGLILTASAMLITWLYPLATFVQHTLLLGALLTFSLGFVFWCAPAFPWVWTNPIGKVLIVVLHLFVLLIATAYARIVVSTALGLPPQDFDVSVAFITLVLYVPAWFLVVSFLGGTAAIALFLSSLLIGFSRLPFKHTAKLSAQACGALAICFIAANTFDFVGQHKSSLFPIVKWVALFSDYQEAEKYPGIRKGERVRLHENGVVSFAAVENNAVVVRVVTYESRFARSSENTKE